MSTSDTTTNPTPDLPCTARPDLFFDTRAAAVERAVALCETCPVMTACRTWAIAHDEPHGTWGGSTEAQRRERRTGQRECATPPRNALTRGSVVAA